MIDETHTDATVQKSSFDLQMNNDEDRCTENGEVCLYNHICYNIDSQQWATSKDIVGQPLMNNMGLNNRDELKEEHEHHRHSQCNEKFQPVQSNDEMIKKKNLDDKQIHYIDGTTYHVCCWIDHFGHTLMNMVLPAFHALTKMELQNEFGTMKYLIENRNRFDLTVTWDLFRFFTVDKDQVLSFSKIQNEAKSNGQSHICFKRLVVGMYHDTLIDVEIGDTEGTKMELDMLQPMKDHVAHLHPVSKEAINAALQETLLSNQTNPHSPKECTVTLLERQGSSRQIVNTDETIELIKEVFNPLYWNFQRVAFEKKDSSSHVSQYMTLQSTKVFISVSGTATHLSMFLPDGSVDLEIKYFDEKWNNKLLCGVLPTLHCLTSDAKDMHGHNYTLAKNSDVVVDLDEFKIALLKAYDQAWTRCYVALRP